MDILTYGLLDFPTGELKTVADPIRELRLAIDASCRGILPDAIGLTDAFAYSDWELDRCVQHVA